MSIQDEVNRLDEEIRKNRELLADPELFPLANDEITRLEDQRRLLLSTRTNTPSPRQETRTSQTDASNALIEIRGAAGGDEAKIWAKDLRRMYMRFASIRGLETLELDNDTLKVKGRNAYGLLKYESGVHRVQRIPETERGGRIHTSTATVAVLPEIPESEIVVNPDDLEWQFTRSGGHGGQNVNKVNTAVRLTHKLTGTIVNVRQERFQQQNKAIALELLRAKLWELEEEKRLRTIDSARKTAVGRGMRAEKIRTYNFPQNRVTDHRLNKSWHSLERVLDGDLDEIIEVLKGQSEGDGRGL